MPTRLHALLLLVCVFTLTACASVKYNTLEKFGIHKRDLLVDNVEDTRDAQKEAQEQFSSALDRFGDVVKLEESDLKKAYDALDDEYQDSVDAAEEVSDNIRSVEQVAEDLFDEWDSEIKEYSDANLKKASASQLKATRDRYTVVHKAMLESEKSMQPVLATLKDNVLFLKHNLNAQAIGSLKSTFSDLQGNIDVLLKRMNQSIERSNKFIAEMQPQ